MRVAITGASGLIGKALVTSLQKSNHQVTRMVRGTAGPGELFWNPHDLAYDSRTWPSFDAVVHLAGENLAAGRWTRNRMEKIRDSRVLGTTALSQAIARAPNRPTVFISASAVGIYGSRGDEILTEGATSGTGFLAEVGRQWEAAVEPAREAGIRAINLRMGIVLSPAGGALRQMAPLFRLGLGGRLGSGQQWWSWVSLEDLIEMIALLLQSPDWEGPVNATSPNPVTNAEFPRLLAKALHRPALLPVPRWGLRATIGQLADEALLASQRCMPARLQKAGFQFRHPELSALFRQFFSSDIPR